MIDIHTHILPGIDDGSEDLDMSLDMVFMARESGVNTIVTTNHCNIPGVYDNYVSEELGDLWNKLDRELKNARADVTLLKGMEIFATPELPYLLESKRVWTLNDTRYFLMEFSFEEDARFAYEVLDECVRRGFKPIIAHPERYYFLQRDPQIAYDWYVKGYGLQVNKGSLLGRFGRNEKQTADSLMRHGLVTAVASDAHRPYVRTPDFREVRRYLLEEYGREYTYMVTEDNPGRILRGAPLVGYEPIPYEEDRDFYEYEDYDDGRDPADSSFYDGFIHRNG